MTNEKIAEQLVKECGITAPYDNLKKLVMDALEMKEGMAKIDSTTTSKTNKEKANLIAAGTIIGDRVITYSEIKYDAALQMAKWKDEQFEKILDETYEMRKEICRSNVSFADLTEFVQQLRKKINKEE